MLSRTGLRGLIKVGRSDWPASYALPCAEHAINLTPRPHVLLQDRPSARSNASKGKLHNVVWLRSVST